MYYTAGFPALNDTLRIAKELESAGADMIEIGIPYSDPLADGPTIQQSCTTAIANGMTVEVLLSQLKNLKKEVKIPVLLMGYFNPILQYGVEKFCKTCADIGVVGLIIPDLPMYEYETVYKPIFEQYKLSMVFLVTPQSSTERIKKIDSLSNGFIYALSSSSITGKQADFADTTKKYLDGLAKLKLNNPIVVGFGIHDKTTFEAACAHSQGAIIGSAFVKHLAGGGTVASFVKSVKG